jgi:ribosomal protein S18 acetylase RimI-like enzyme
MKKTEFLIRQAIADDITKIAYIEEKCFPKSEAASLKSFFERFMAFPECFLVAEVDGTVVGHINGCVTSNEKLEDALYHNAALHEPNGPWQTVFGIAVLPEYQHQGMASALMEHFKENARNRGKQGILLTCKDEKIGFYEKLGFTYDGVSGSGHGGARWNDMFLKFS